jgi:hypothetical protein
VIIIFSKGTVLCGVSYSIIYLSDTVILLQPKVKSGEHAVIISLQDESVEYLSGHVIDGRNLFPATGYLVSFTKIFLLIYVLLYDLLTEYGICLIA